MKRTIIALALGFTATLSVAACPQLYPAQLLQPKNTVELCNDFFVTRYHTASKAAVYSTEKLSANTPVGALTRLSSFHVDSRVPGSPTSTAYSGSGFDRGHLAPSDDASTAIEMYQTFGMTNMTPQNPTLNRGAWARLEQSVRAQFYSENTDYYVTTVAVYKKPLKLIGPYKVPVPNGYWKVVNNGLYSKYYFADNVVTGTVAEYSNIDINTIINNSTQALN